MSDRKSLIHAARQKVLVAMESSPPLTAAEWLEAFREINERLIKELLQEEVTQGRPLEQLTIRDLKKLAKERSIPGYWNLSKTELLVALNKTP